MEQGHGQVLVHLLGVAFLACLALPAAGYLVEVEDQVQLAHVAEVVVQDLHKQVHAFQVGQLVVGGVHTQAEEQARVPSVDDLVALELRAEKCWTVRQNVAVWCTVAKFGLHAGTGSRYQPVLLSALIDLQDPLLLQ